jgi:hypothetical protein
VSWLKTLDRDQKTVCLSIDEGILSAVNFQPGSEQLFEAAARGHS